MNFKLSGWSLLALALLTGGCASLDYQGESLPPTTTVKVIKAQSQVVEYRQIGTATVSGAYSDYCYEELLQKLVKKARNVGADAIYVTSYEVVPVDKVRDDQLLGTTPTSSRMTNDRSANDLNMMQRQLDDPASRIGAKASQADPNVYTYKRVISAVFLKKK